MRCEWIQLWLEKRVENHWGAVSGTFGVLLGHELATGLDKVDHGSACVSFSAGCSLKVLADSERYTWIVL